MDVLREVDAYCASCDDIQGHAVMADDPSSCFCNLCGTVQPLMEPVIDAPRWHRTAPATWGMGGPATITPK